MLNRLQDVFKSFQKNDVKYVVIGGIAVALHGVPRATFDLDILIEATTENARRLLTALTEARFGTAAMTNANDIVAHEITVFSDRVRIDVQTSTPGIDFKDVWPRKMTLSYQGQDFFVLCKDDLLANATPSR